MDQCFSNFTCIDEPLGDIVKMQILFSGPRVGPRNWVSFPNKLLGDAIALGSVEHSE